jgi:DNA-binding PadR family transcriptional regulator
MLKEMEREGLVESEWVTDSSGPAHRTFRITESGKICLDRWKWTLEAYITKVESLLALINRPYTPVAPAEPK